MTRWEYKTISYYDRRHQFDEKELNDLGYVGWEAVSIEQIKDGVIATFKREMADD